MLSFCIRDLLIRYCEGTILNNKYLFKAMYLKKINQKEPIIMAAMPKSASQTLKERILKVFRCELIGLKACRGIGHLIMRDHIKTSKKLKLCILQRRPFIYQHFLPHDYNRTVLRKKFNISKIPKCIVTIRNIDEAIISAENHQWRNSGPISIFKQDKEFYRFETEFSHAHIWYGVFFVKFYAAWYIANELGIWNVKFVHFSDIVGKPSYCIEDIADFFSLNSEITKEKLVNLKSVARNITEENFTQRKQLPYQSLEFIRNFSLSFKGIDFSRIGL